MTTKYDNQSLQELAERISEKVKESDQLINQADQLIIEAAEMVVVAKRHVEDGRAGQNVLWYDWAKEHIGLGESRLKDLHAIGTADDPLAELQRQRGLVRDRAKKRREKKKSETPIRIGGEPKPDPTKPAETQSAEDKERAALIEQFVAWAQTVNIDELRREVTKIVDPLAIPTFLDRRPIKEAA